MTVDEPTTAWKAFLDLWRNWPVFPRLLWLVVRPLCTVVAVVCCALGWIGGASVLGSVGAALLVALVRPVRHPWIAILLAVVVFPVSWVAAAAVLVRAVAGVVAMILAGGTWRGGLDVVRRGRAALFVVDSPEQLEQNLRDALRSGADSLDALDTAFELWSATWACADVVRLARVTWMLAKGLLLGRWPWTAAPALEVRLLRLAIAESSIDRGLQLAVVTIVVVTLLLTGLTTTGTLFGWVLPAWVSLLPAAWVARLIASRPKINTLPITGTVLVVVAGFWLYGWEFVRLAGCGIAVGLPLGVMAETLKTRMLGPKEPAPRLPLGVGGSAARDVWASARIAMEQGRPRIAARLWRTLTHDHHPPAVSAAAFAALAHVNLADGAVQAAVSDAQQARDRLSHAKRVRPQVVGTAGRVLLAAGDTDAATELLGEAFAAGQHRRDPLISTAMARVLALHDNADEALRLLNESAGGLLRSGNLREMVDSELTVIALISTRIGPAETENRLQQLLSFDMNKLDGLGDQQVIALRSTMGRIYLFLGRVQLGMTKYGTAAANLRTAINMLTLPSDGFDQAVARILLGTGLNRANRYHGLPEVTAGVRQLESLRGQLAAGAHRSRLIIRHDEVYDRAFDTLVRLQNNDGTVAVHAFELAESLKRSALATMLREPGIELSDRVRELKHQISEVEERGQVASDGHRRELTEALSDRFASAYLPEPVDVTALRAALHDVHCVVYHMSEVSAERAVGHVVWMPPTGLGVVRRIEVTDRAVLAILNTEDRDARHGVMAALESPEEIVRWQLAAKALLPTELRAAMMAAAHPLTLVVVPGAELSALPWAALRLDDGRTALEAAVIQLTPTLAMLQRRVNRASPGGEVLAYLNPSVDRRAVGEVLPDLTHRPISSRNAMLAALRARTAAGVYIAAHGEGTGLEQHVAFHDGSLSAATSLEEPWPTWAVFQSCFVGEVRVTTGDDPLGLPVSCLLGGAEGVIGGVIAINMIAARELCPAVVRGLAGGKHPAVALRDAQLDYFTSSRLRSPARWAGLVCLSRTLARP
ncbi:CHAT domain-containing protein [Lentzea sp. BCCO 10_0061]|uniref:CHAT domain-containing protein n=1 Tax=Lentzea sokolovensis TaxID=3095429 RepID=A0ABU4UPZ6_9PSEU|nr:CHAT domain-containing protein [Lentzea sp. BCCO 10_0061]MDX8141566.1 CHAT domain-containing protein [Lentzea sp. BCCO 10_0061]